jgi:hypothetical protein
MGNKRRIDENSSNNQAMGRRWGGFEMGIAHARVNPKNCCNILCNKNKEKFCYFDDFFRSFSGKKS